MLPSRPEEFGGRGAVMADIGYLTVGTRGGRDVTVRSRVPWGGGDGGVRNSRKADGSYSVFGEMMYDFKLLLFCPLARSTYSLSPFHRQISGQILSYYI